MATTKKQLHQELKRNFVIERIEELGIKKYQGKPLHGLDYEELKMVLVLAVMRRVDVEHPDHAWFR